MSIFYFKTPKGAPNVGKKVPSRHSFLSFKQFEKQVRLFAGLFLCLLQDRLEGIDVGGQFAEQSLEETAFLLGVVCIDFQRIAFIVFLELAEFLRQDGIESRCGCYFDTDSQFLLLRGEAHKVFRSAVFLQTDIDFVVLQLVLGCETLDDAQQLVCDSHIGFTGALHPIFAGVFLALVTMLQQQ